MSQVAYELLICDWSSDVCSSDLKGLRVARLAPGGPAEAAGIKGPLITRRGLVQIEDRSAADIIVAVNGHPVATAAESLGAIESQERKSDVERKSGSVRVNLGGIRIYQKQNSI